ncbi:disease resistance protein Roq1-like [Cryptomeria japonica]|uniref:disease resistance protein Roq1-like n=1 Tax=Cryptomeria japonica TaxID=3369 RepID=UPI0027DA8163|nr:disease resistance protein Roq1-like [Cryptomeria japonica]
MDKDNSRQLFTWHAFSQPHPASGYEDLVDDFLGVCGGLPLSLQVLGRHVHGRDENYWRLELEKLGGTMHGDIKKSLKISFEHRGKSNFHGHGMLIIDQRKYIAIRVWKASGWSAENGLQVLKDKCLVEEIEDHIPLLRMHDHLRDLGRQMANELSEPRRLWRPRDLKKLESMKFENIVAQTKGRCFHSYFDKSLNSQVKFFLGESADSVEMSSCLLLLHIWYTYLYSGPNSSNLNHLRHLQDGNLSVQPGIPSWIPLQNMQCLRISNGYFKRLWQHDAEAPSELKKLEIYGTFRIPPYIVKTCRRLSGSLPTTSVKETSSFTVPFNGGTKSVTVKASLSLLEDLVIREQENIRRFVIDGNYCPSLQSLEISSLRNLIELQFRRVEKLKCLNVSKCEFLRILSVTSDFTELEELNIAECSMLEEPNLGHLSCMKTIRIENCNMISVPGMFNFKMLVELNISRCPKLHELCLAHLHCLENLIVKDCDNLKSVTGLSYLLKLVEVSISWCGMLQLDLCLAGFNSLKRIKADRSVKLKCFDLKDCKNLETVSGISFEMIRVVNNCGCPELKSFPVIRGRRCLEMIIIDGCGKLNYLTLTDCGILKGVSGNFDLDGLSISDCLMLKELPSFGQLIDLEEIRILQCGSLQNMTLPITLKRLELNSCRELKTMVGICGLRTLAEINIKGCPKLRLELNLCSLNSLKRITIVECLSVYNITLPTTLIEITLQRCMKLQFKAGISHLTKLRELHVSECPVIEEMPVVCGLSCLERITIDGWGKFSFLHVTDCVILKSIRGNLDMGHLAQLWISDCPELEELPCFARLTCLVEIRIFRCRKLQQVTLPRTLKNLQLVACKELKSVSEISHLKNLVELIISQCGQLELELRLEAIDSLHTITFDGCGKIMSFQLNKCQNIKRVSSNFEVERISICGCHELEELSIRNCRELNWVKEINIESCDKLQNITLPARLTNLIVQRCRHLQRIAGMDDLSKLTELEITECPEIELPFLAELSRLERITINYSEKLH